MATCETSFQHRSGAPAHRSGAFEVGKKPKKRFGKRITISRAERTMPQLCC